MQKQQNRLYLGLILFLGFSVLSLSHYAWSDEAQNAQTREQKIQQRVTELQRIFGPVNFAREEPVKLFEVMLYTWPQPVEAMQEFGDKNLHLGTAKRIDEWMQFIFREKFRPNVVQNKPTRYYLGNKHESDLLEFKWQADGLSFSMLDNWNTILLTPDPESSGLKPEGGVSGQALAKFLVKVFNLPHTSEEETVRDFKLPNTLQIGDVFTNTDTKAKHPLLMKGWQSFVIGFIGKNGVNVVCFKVRNDPVQREIDLRHLNHWLGRSLLENDGKTLVKRPTN